MKPNCPNVKCTFNENKTSKVVRNGTFYRKSDSRWITRFHCRSCGTYFSSSTSHPLYRLKNRRIDHRLKLLMCSGVSQRRAALLLDVDAKTIVRHIRRLALDARRTHSQWIEDQKNHSLLTAIQFDDLETSEHTKCKPLSVVLAVDEKTRKILGFEVSRMPAKGHLAKKALKKYGKRVDERSKGWDRLLKGIKPLLDPHAVITSDENPHYPKFVKRHHPKARHIRVPGGRGCIAGQGELKKLVFDPLFSLNHTCAMWRANLNRLFRRTWCTTKTIQGLIDHLSLYIVFHNQVLTRTKSAVNGGS